MIRFRPASISYRATALLCVALALNLCFWTGCDSVPTNSVVPQAAQVSIALKPGDEISRALADTGFEGADRLDVDLAARTFALHYPDASRVINGRFEQVNGAWEMAEFSFAKDSASAQMKFDPQTKQVVEIQTAQGDHWQPEEKVDASNARVSSGDRFQSYLASNPELTGADVSKGKNNASLVFFAPFFIYIMWIWILCANSFATCPGFAPIFWVIVAILGAIPLPGPDASLNLPPDARDDAFSTPGNTPLLDNVLPDHGSGPDTDPDGDALSTTLVTPPASGMLQLNLDGSFTYTPNDGFVGTDTFTYQLSDGRGGTDNAVATITVENLPPVARDDAFMTAPETTVTGNVLDDNGSAADSDPNSDPLTVIEVNGDPALVGVPIPFPFSTLLTINADGSFLFEVGGSGDYMATYTISDGRGGTSMATFSAHVPDPP